MCLATRTDNNSCFDSSNRLHESPERRYVIFSEILSHNKSYANNTANECAKHFFAVFFYLKNKRLARAKNDVVFIFFNCL